MRLVMICFPIYVWLLRGIAVVLALVFVFELCTVGLLSFFFIFYLICFLFLPLCFVSVFVLGFVPLLFFSPANDCQKSHRQCFLIPPLSFVLLILAPSFCVVSAFLFHPFFSPWCFFVSCRRLLHYVYLTRHTIAIVVVFLALSAYLLSLIRQVCSPFRW